MIMYAFGGGGGVGGGVGAGTFVCSKHGKSRNARYMEEDGQGGMRCVEGSECKGAGDAPSSDDSVRCSLHGKLRSGDCLEEDENGQMVCKPGRRCKVAGDMPDGRGVGQDRPYGYGSRPIPGDHGGMWPQANPLAWAQQAAAWYQSAGMGAHVPAWAHAGQMPTAGMGYGGTASGGQMPVAAGMMPGGMPGMPGGPMSMPWGMPGMPGMPGMLGMPGMPGIPSLQDNRGDPKSRESRSRSQTRSRSRSRSRGRKKDSSSSSSSSSSESRRKKKKKR